MTSKDKSERPGGKRPGQANKFSAGKPKGDKPFGAKSFGDKGGKPRGDKPFAAKPRADKEDAGAKPARRSGGKVAPKYANPADASQTWTGRGRRPIWVQAALDSGKTLNDLEI